MRNISSTALAKITQQYAVEPIMLVKIYWYDLSYIYSDKNEDFRFFGHILSLSGLESSSTTGSITVTLDDSQGYLFDIFNSIDTHKRKIQVLQWFDSMPLEDAFVVFDGLINTPMDWSEADRTFTFTGVNIIENREFGFSFEEGRFSIPNAVVGKPWPVVIGRVLKVPALQYTEHAQAVLAEGFGVIGYAAYATEAKNLEDQRINLINKSQELAQAASAKEVEAIGYNDGIEGESGNTFSTKTNPPDDLETYHQLKVEAQELRIQLAQTFVDYRNLLNDIRIFNEDFAQKKLYERDVVRIASDLLPQGQDIEVEINGHRFVVQVNGQVMNIKKELKIIRDVLPSFFNNVFQNTVSTRHTSDIQKEKFIWYDGGSQIELISKPIIYIVCLGRGTVLGVWGRSHNGVVKVPDNYYTISIEAFGSGLEATVLTMHRALSTYRGQQFDKIWDTNDVFCDVIGYVPPRWESIINWTVDTFANYTLDPVLYPENRDKVITNLTIDPISFSLVRPKINVPMNFAILDRPNVLDFIKAVCFQANVKVWLVGNELRFMYLREEPTAVATITEDDVIENSLTLSCTPTESLVTKLSATWKYSYHQPEANLMIIRYNVLKYGIQAQTYNYFALGQQDLVADSLGFWATRLGNSFKIIKFKTNLQCLAVEANDPVLIQIYGYDVIGIVERMNYDSLANQIEFTVWLPIRWGEKDKFTSAYPGAITNVLASNIELNTGTPYFDLINPGVLAASGSPVHLSYGKPWPDNKEIEGVYPPPEQSIGAVTTALTNVSVRYDRPSGIENSNNSVSFTEDRAVSGGTTAPTGNIVNIGTVQGGAGNNYSVTTVDGKTVNAQQLYIGAGYDLKPGTVVYLVFVKKNKKWYMQAPVWYDE